MVFNQSKQRLIENFLSYELRLSENKKSEKVINITDLLVFDDKRFIAELYRKLLEREPDPEGYDLYLNLLKNGKTKEFIILFIHSLEIIF